MPDTTLKHVPGMGEASPIPVVDADKLSEALFIANYISDGQPCVIKKAVQHWSAIRKWHSKEYLKRCSGHHQVYVYPHENHVTTNRIEIGERLVTFSEAIDFLHSEDTQVGFVGTATPVELLADIGDFSFLKNPEPAFFYPAIRFFMYRDAGSTWHYHSFDETLMCQIIGTKKVGLVRARGPNHKALRDIFFREDYYDDPAAFSELSNDQLHWFSATVEEGDALYIPPLWWHGVVPVGTAFGVTAAVPWRSPLHVIADGIKRMAAGEVDLIGKENAPNVPALVNAARELGLEQELALAWRRGV